MKDHKIAIVGAGLAGLTTAFRLVQKGHDVELYEARERVGGRVLTVKFENSHAELGAQNILDGGDSSNILKLIEDLGLKTVTVERVFHLTNFDGAGLSEPFAGMDIDYQFTPETLMPYLEEVAEASENMEQVIETIFSEKPNAIKFISNILAGYEGAPPERLSTYYIKTLYYMLLGGLSEAHQVNSSKSMITQLEVEGGNSNLTEALGHRLKDLLHLRHPLISLKKSGSKYHLLFDNGKSAEADIVVLAIPSTVYKNIKFDDHVISHKQLKEIESIQYGSTSKILAPLLGVQEDHGVYYNNRTVMFYNIDRSVAQVYYTGGNGYFTKENIQHEFSKELPMIEYAYTIPEKTKIVEYAKEIPYAIYKSSVGYCWTLEPYSLGSYSYVGSGQDDLVFKMETYGSETVKSVFAPVDGTLFFAGEHASTLLAVGGTMESAVESGERTARMIDEQTPKYLYKVLTIENWNGSQGQKNLKLASADDDFIHFSKEDQLERITSKFFADIPEYVILKIESAKLPGRMVYETNPGGSAKYYHLYDGFIPLDSIVESKIIKK